MRQSGFGRWFMVVAALAMVALPAQARTPEQVADAALKAAPVWDGHNDVPEQLRERRGNMIADFDFTEDMYQFIIG